MYSSPSVVMGKTEREGVVGGKRHLGGGIANGPSLGYKGGREQEGSWPCPG